jgi:hypothetical protein
MKQSGTRKCVVCRTVFVKRSMTHKVCSADCGVLLSLSNKTKAQRKQDKVRLEELKPRKWWLAKAKTALHAYIRARDEGRSCISCYTILIKAGRVGGDYDAGHFRSVGSSKHMEFVPENIHGQCKKCNNYLNGNQIEYERRLRIRYSDEYVDTLLNDNKPRHLTIDDFKQIEAEYKFKLKEINSLK